MGKGRHKEAIEYSIEIGENKMISIEADEVFSSKSIQVSQGQKYQVTCDPNEKWYDLFFSSSALGYNNPLAQLAGMRVNKAKCFCLCGAFDQLDTTSFSIGFDKTITVEEHFKELNFFANDTRNFYWNNFGRITIKVTRLA